MIETIESLTPYGTNQLSQQGTCDVLFAPDEGVKAGASFFQAPRGHGRSPTAELTNEESPPLTYSFASNRQADRETPEIPVPRPSPARHSVLAIQKWEGYVVEVQKESFAARLTDLTNPGTQEDAEFAACELSPDDLPLLRTGAVFYWTIGRQTDSTGRQQTISELRFRRLPSWTPEEYREASVEAKRIAHLLGINQAIS